MPLKELNFIKDRLYKDSMQSCFQAMSNGFQVNKFLSPQNTNTRVDANQYFTDYSQIQINKGSSTLFSRNLNTVESNDKDKLKNKL